MKGKMSYNKDMIIAHGYWQLTWMISFDYLPTVLNSGWRVMTHGIANIQTYGMSNKREGVGAVQISNFNNLAQLNI